jgi:S-formylglutathione hydrolase FrmB
MNGAVFPVSTGSVRTTTNRTLVAAALTLLSALLLSWPALPAAAVPSQSPAPSAEARGQCVSVPSRILGRSIPYCVILPAGYARDASRHYPVLYFLHGLGDNEQMFLHSGGFDLVQELWDRRQIGDFIIASPAGYASFFMNSQDGRFRYDDFFLQEFIPWIESHYRIAARRQSRGIGGISMGGYGALRLAFLHPRLFGSVSVHSAALMERLPLVSVNDSLESGRLRLLGNVFGSPPDHLFWDRNNPLRIARTAELAGMKIYFDCGSEDDYGFEAGAQALHNVLDARRIPHEFHLYPGGHTWSYFAAHLPDSLRFQSAAFHLSDSHAAGGTQIPR